MDEFPSLLDLARSRNRDAADEILIVNVASELVELLGLEPPIDPEVIASYQGITRVERVPLQWAGCLLTTEEGLIIRVRSTDPPQRQRFTVCHEIGHTFLPGFQYTPQYRCTPLAQRRRPDPVEALCDIAASALLLPATHVDSYVSTVQFGWDAVEELGYVFDVSLEAAARRFVSAWPEPCVLIRLEVTTKPTDPEGVPRLRVAGTHVNGSWPYMPRYKSVQDDHVLAGCLQGVVVEGVATLDDLAVVPAGPVELHARPYPYTDSEGVHHDRVLALARRPI